jgi:MtN3 and saliva related transmembrane protein
MVGCRQPWRERDTAAISKRMYLVTVSAFTLWSVYGFMIGNLPIIIFNLLSLALSGAILFMKIRNERRDGHASPQREPTMARSG